MIYEVRIYEAEDGKATAMRERFRDHVVSRLAHHGIEVVGAFVAAGRPDDGRLTYITRSADEATRSVGWSAFAADPEWKAIKADSEQDGPLLKGQSVAVIESFVGGLALD